MSKIQRLREQIYLLQGSKCFYCSRAIPLEERTFEHVVPGSVGGEASIDNGVVVCSAANQLLGNASPKQKMVMMKSGGGCIECPKKSVQQLAKPAQYVEEQDNPREHHQKQDNKDLNAQMKKKKRSRRQTAPRHSGSQHRH